MIRYQFTDSGIHAADIHPGSIFSLEQKLAKAFVEKYPTDSIIDDCPVSQTPRTEILFSKWGRRYAICPLTWSLGLAELPSDEVLFSYYHESDLAEFRASPGYQATVTKTRKNLWLNALEWIEGRIIRYLGSQKKSIIETGPKTMGWIKLLQSASFVDRLDIIDPLPPIILGKQDKLETADVVLLNDVIQRYRHPDVLIKKVSQYLAPGGVLMGTCRSGSGFDILTLREASESVFPFDHVTLPSPKGMQQLLIQNGFEILEISTPGLLDCEFIKNSKEHIPKDQFFQRYLAFSDEEQTLENLQAFLQRNNLSSHLRFVAKKKA